MKRYFEAYDGNAPVEGMPTGEMIEVPEGDFCGSCKWAIPIDVSKDTPDGRSDLKASFFNLNRCSHPDNPKGVNEKNKDGYKWIYNLRGRCDRNTYEKVS